MITIIDYGLGNIRAFVNVYQRLNIPVKIAKSVIDLKGSTKMILPGVGAFDHAMTLLGKSGMRESLDDLVLNHKIPIIGICVGMQILASSSEEGNMPGLGWIDGCVKKIDPVSLVNKTLLPHMGWNSINPLKVTKLLDELDFGSRFYFLHSYYFHCNNEENSLAITEYGGHFSSVVNSENIYGVQFHPEKSHQNGIQVLKNFATL